MLFQSLTFLLCFFPLVLLVSRGISPWRGRKLFLLGASAVFYGAWNPPFLLLLWFSTVVDWVLAGWIHRSREPSVRRACLFLSLGTNLGLLGFFKYAGFLAGTLEFLVRGLGGSWVAPGFEVLLPVGISFYTFQTLSYTLDVYRGRIEPCPSFLDYALYVTFFPQLVAGPIVRAEEFLPQCVAPRKGSSRQLGWGAVLILVGLFQKVVVADRLMSGVVGTVYAPGADWTFLSAWTGTMAFGVQIFCDFSGYSTCAIGVALCLGFVLPENFRSPYAAIGFFDFWQRWHITLSNWLRDYLFRALGGARGGGRRALRNVLVTMMLAGLWHGASWMFVFWGGLQGGLLVSELALRRYWRRCGRSWTAGWIPPALALVTYLLFCLTGVFFRARSPARAGSLVLAMLGLGGSPDAQDLPFLKVVTVLLVNLGLLGIHWRLRESSLEEAFERTPHPLRVLALSGMLLLLVLSLAGEESAHVYFQF